MLWFWEGQPTSLQLSVLYSGAVTTWSTGGLLAAWHGEEVLTEKGVLEEQQGLTLWTVSADLDPGHEEPLILEKTSNALVENPQTAHLLELWPMSEEEQFRPRHEGITEGHTFPQLGTPESTILSHSLKIPWKKTLL